MNCPRCNSEVTRVKKTTDNGSCITRARQCMRCQSSWFSDEKVREGSFVAGLLVATNVQATKDTPLPSPPHSPSYISPPLAPPHPTPQKNNTQQKSPQVIPNNEEEITQTEYSPYFLDVWKGYCRKEGKRAAWNAWKNMSKKLPGGEESLHRLVTTAISGWQGAKFAADNWKFAPHLERYIRDCRWEDEPETTNVNRPPGVSTPWQVDPKLKPYYDEIDKKYGGGGK